MWGGYAGEKTQICLGKREVNAGLQKAMDTSWKRSETSPEGAGPSPAYMENSIQE